MHEAISAQEQTVRDAQVEQQIVAEVSKRGTTTTQNRTVRC